LNIVETHGNIDSRASASRRSAVFPIAEHQTTASDGQKTQKGAAAVEFAFALLALFFFFAVYMQFIQIFLLHEQLVFAGFTASRTHAVRGEIPARQAANAIDADARIRIDGNEVLLLRNIPIPAALSDIFAEGNGVLPVTHRSPFFDEIDLTDRLKGDN
jgi:hypothetical protein